MTTLITKPAPDFIAPAVMPDNTINNAFRLSEYIQGKYAVIFFYPLDFTFVCPTELIAFNHSLDEFYKRNTVVIAVSTDSQYSHLAYKALSIQAGGIGNIQYPMVADVDKSISEQYGVLFEKKIALRATFITSKVGIIRHQSVNDLPIGRNVEETLRLVDAIQYHEKHGDICPANWQKEGKTMKPNQESVTQYLRNKYNN